MSVCQTPKVHSFSNVCWEPSCAWGSRKEQGWQSRCPPGADLSGGKTHNEASEDGSTNVLSPRAEMCVAKKVKSGKGARGDRSSEGPILSGWSGKACPRKGWLSTELRREAPMQRGQKTTLSFPWRTEVQDKGPEAEQAQGVWRPLRRPVQMEGSLENVARCRNEKTSTMSSSFTK